MNKNIFLLSAGLLLTGISSFAQEEFQRDTISMGAGYENTIFYSLDNAETHSLNNSSWDIAFRTTPMTVGTYLNQATKNWDLIQLFIEDGTSITAEDYFMNDLTSDFNAKLNATDLEDYKFFNSITTWDTGAFNKWSPDDPQINFNLGWGMYDMSTHKIEGQKVFALTVAPAFPGAPVDPNAPTYKFYIKDHDPTDANRPWEFWYAPLDATTEAEIQKVQFNGSDYGNKLMVYFSFEDGEMHDYDPNQDAWDLSFTRYKEYVTQGQTSMWYGVTGVLLNRGIGAYGEIDESADEIETDFDENAPFEFLEWDESINLDNQNIAVIGRDWRGSNLTGEYAIKPNNYFVRSKGNKIYHVRMRRAALGSGQPDGFDAGDIIFEYKLVDGGVNINEWKENYTWSIYPNPSNDYIKLAIENTSSQKQTAQLVITDMSGRHVMVQNFALNQGKQEIQVALNSLKAGAYIVYLQLEEGLLSKKFLKH